MRPPCQSGASQNFESLSVGWYWIVADQVKVVSNWILSKVQLFITYQVLVLFLYFRRDFASTWKNDTKKHIVNTTLATTLSTSRKLPMMLLTHSFKRVSSVNQGTRSATESWNWLFKNICQEKYLQLRQDRSVHSREILLVPSPDEGGGKI